MVVVLTSSAADSDVEQAYELGANSYLLKPGTIEERQELVEKLESYWLKANKVPTSFGGESVA